MQTTLLPAQPMNARPLAARSPRSSRDNLAAVLAGAGALLLPVATFLPWYRDADNDGGTLSAWGGYWFVIAAMLLVFAAGATLALSILAGRPLRRPAVSAVIALALVATITVVISLFIVRPGGNAGTAVAFGGYVTLTALGTIKGGAILTQMGARKR